MVSHSLMQNIHRNIPWDFTALEIENKTDVHLHIFITST